jgi:hypothetical protein
MTVHVLKAGLAVCGAGAPIYWPKDDTWVSVLDPEREQHATCVECRVKLGMRLSSSEVGTPLAGHPPKIPAPSSGNGGAS